MNRAPNLVLIGFMASGKSSVGRRCAEALGFRFWDTDAFIERRTGKSIPEIFAEQGEAAFRAMEVAAIRHLAAQPKRVIATGGGAPMNPENVAALRRSGVIVLLHASIDELLARVGNRRHRPLLADAEDPRTRIEELLAMREPVYRAAADGIVDTTGLTHEEVAERVLALYRERAPCWRPLRE
jgi:shikimate kinase